MEIYDDPPAEYVPHPSCASDGCEILLEAQTGDYAVSPFTTLFGVIMEGVPCDYDYGVDEVLVQCDPSAPNPCPFEVVIRYTLTDIAAITTVNETCHRTEQLREAFRIARAATPDIFPPEPEAN